MNPAPVIVCVVGAFGAFASVLMTLGFWHKFNIDETCFEPSQRLTNKLIVAGAAFGIASGILRIVFLLR